MKHSRSGILFATSFDRFKHSEDAHRIRVLDMPYIGRAKHSTGDELRRVFRILKAARSEKVLLLNSSSGRFQPDTMALAVVGLLPKRWRPKIALMGEMWEPNTGLRHLLDFVVVKLADHAVDCYIVHSSDEVNDFPRLWGVDASKVRCCLYFSSLTQQEFAASNPPKGNHIFAGGNSHRDYAPLVEVARQMPDRQFVFATNRLKKDETLPSNVTVGEMPHDKFLQWMRSSAAVVTCIRKGLRRSAGQQTYLNAMLLGKPAIVNQTFGVEDHITNGVDGLIVDGSPESYVRTLHHVLNPANANAIENMCRAARRTASERFSYKRHLENAVKLMVETFHLAPSVALENAS